MSSTTNSLPPKESTLLQKLRSSFARKEYKNGLKFAKQILSNPKFSEHGETLAVKGLTLNAMGRKEEAYECVRKGLKSDLRSHVCWHVYGLLQKSDRKYDEAIKCYRNGLKWDKDNIQILRDLSLLQIQTRDLEGYRDSSYQLFELTSGQIASWIMYAVSLHLLGEYKNCLNILDRLLNLQQIRNYYSCYQCGELLLYQNLVIRESGNFEQALKHLEVNQIDILDKVTLKEVSGDLHLELKQFKNAEKCFRYLINRNPENSNYYDKLISAKQLTKREDILNFYYGQSEEYPKAKPPKRMALNYAVEETFENLIDNYLRRGFRKGVPALFVELKLVYVDTRKVEIIEKLLLQYVDALTTSGTFSNGEFNDSVTEPASCLIWVYYFLAQHYDYLKKIEEALSYINIAILHTPTLIELYITKGRIYKHAGDLNEACKWLDEAQSLDTADRCINSKCVKYMLKANRVQEAEKISSKVTRTDVSAMTSLNEMQCMWFQTECALAYQRLGKYGESLQKCHEVDRHFSEIIDDEYQFHSYSTRTMTLQSYWSLLKVEDNLRKSSFYFKAAQCAIEVYVHLFDTQLKDNGKVEEDNLSPSELKKLRNKQRKAQKKAEAAKAEAKNNPKVKKGGVDADLIKLEELIPESLEKVNDPLEQAIKFLQPLQNLAQNRIETHLMAFEIYFRKQKFLLMLQSLKRARSLNSSHPQLHACKVRFWQLLNQNLGTLDLVVREVVDNETPELFDNSENPMQLNRSYLERNDDCLNAVLEGAKILYALNPNLQSEAIKLVTNLYKYQNVDIEICKKVLKSLKIGEFGKCDAPIEEFMKECQSRFMHAVDFSIAETIDCKL